MVRIAQMWRPQTTRRGKGKASELYLADDLMWSHGRVFQLFNTRAKKLRMFVVPGCL